MKKIKIKNKIISNNSEPFIIAEAGINHNGILKNALKMIDVAKKSGADAIKFQTFKAEEFVGDKRKTYTYFSKGKKITESMLNMFKRYELKDKDWLIIKKRCEKKKIIFFSTPQNYSDLKLLLKVGVPAIKVGSDDFTNLPLINEFKKTKLPIILSTGMADYKEIKKKINLFNKNYPLIIMLCVSKYPASPTDLNLRRFETLKKKFPNIMLGFSDHTIGSEAACLAVGFGARVFEKHFTLSNKMSGPDHFFSEDPKSLAKWIISIKDAYKMLGSKILIPSKDELKMRIVARRSVVAAYDLKKNEKVNINMINFKRPGNGIKPKDLHKILGKKLNKDIKKNQQIKLNCI